MHKAIIAAALAAPLLIAAGCAHPQPVYYTAPPPPPTSYTTVGQLGFRDGYNAGIRDARNGKSPDLFRHGNFKRPPVVPQAAQEYREGFRAGYHRAIGPGGPPAR